MPKTLGFGIDLQVPHLSSLEVSHVHVIFNLNGILMTTSFEIVQNLGPLTWHQKPTIPSHTLVLRSWLKESFQRCKTQFTMYYGD